MAPLPLSGSVTDLYRRRTRRPFQDLAQLPCPAFPQSVSGPSTAPARPRRSLHGPRDDLCAAQAPARPVYGSCSGTLSKRPLNSVQTSLRVPHKGRPGSVEGPRRGRPSNDCRRALQRGRRRSVLPRTGARFLETGRDGPRPASRRTTARVVLSPSRALQCGSDAVRSNAVVSSFLEMS